MSFTTIENARFRKFRDEVLNYSEITMTELWTLVRRYTQGYMGRRFFSEKAKVYYYKFWIKILANSGVITETDKVETWRVNK